MTEADPNSASAASKTGPARVAPAVAMSSAFVVSPSLSASPSAAPPEPKLRGTRGSAGARAARGSVGFGAMALGAGLVTLRRFSRSVPRRALAGHTAVTRTVPKVPGLPRKAATVLAPPEEILGIKPDEKYNVPAGVREKLGKNLLLNEKHPLGILWKTVQDYFAEQDPNCNSAIVWGLVWIHILKSTRVCSGILYKMLDQCHEQYRKGNIITCCDVCFYDNWILTFPLYDSNLRWFSKQCPISYRPRGKFFDTEKPVVSTVECFDKLRVPPDHVSRSPSDTYYVNADYAAWCGIGGLGVAVSILRLSRYTWVYLHLR